MSPCSRLLLLSRYAGRRPIHHHGHHHHHHQQQQHHDPSRIGCPRPHSRRRLLAAQAFSTTTSTSSSLNTTTATATSSSNTTIYPHLFRPLELHGHGGLVLPNRILMGSMHTGLEGLSLPRWAVPFLEMAAGKKNKKNTSKQQEETHLHSLDKLASYFSERAAGGVGLMVTGGVSPNRQGWTGPFSSLLQNSTQADLHKVVTQAVHDHQVPIVSDVVSGSSSASSTGSFPASVKARICLQILHTGRYAYHPFAVSASSTKSPISPFPAKALSARGIQQTIDAFVRTATLAQQAGYDGVEIMGSEGYLLSQFLSPRTNLRHDEYGGGSLENRARLALEIVQQTRQAVGPELIIIFRLSLLDLVEQGLSFDESVIVAGWLQEAGVSILNTGIGWHEARVPTIATSVPRAAFCFPTERLLESSNNSLHIPLVATNRINDPATAEALLAKHSNNDFMVSMARPFLADPEFVNKARENRADEINTCIACNQACLDHVFVGKVASCLVNPRACHETELPKPATMATSPALPVEQRLTIGVIGAGPAGCAFALTAAQQGHSVILYDKDDQIGGQFNMAKRIPGKEEFHETLRYFKTMLMKKYKQNVNIELNTTMTIEQMKSNKAVDKWIVATGVDPRNPKIPGQDNSPNVLSYVDVLKRRAPIGQRVAVIGAGGIGFDVSEYLLHYSGKDLTANEVSKEDFWNEWGVDATLQARGGLVPPQRHGAATAHRQIYLLQRKSTKLGAGLGKTTGWIHRATLNNSGAVEMIKGVKSYDKIDDKGHLHITMQDGTTRVLEVDTIVLCAGQVEHRELQEAAVADASESDDDGNGGVLLKDKVFTIGGAYKAGELDAKRAIDMGTRLALKIHEPGVVPGKHVFAATPGIEESMYDMLQRFVR